MGNIIEINNLSKSFKDANILRNINFSVEKGKIVGIIGRNGSGKTVLFKCICGLNRPTKGTVKINNRELGKDIDVPDRIGVIIENPGFIPNYNAFKNLKFLAMIKNKIEDEQIMDAIALGMPIIVADNSVMSNIVFTNSCGLVYHAGDYKHKNGNNVRQEFDKFDLRKRDPFNVE